MSLRHTLLGLSLGLSLFIGASPAGYGVPPAAPVSAIEQAPEVGAGAAVESPLSPQEAEAFVAAAPAAEPKEAAAPKAEATPNLPPVVPASATQPFTGVWVGDDATITDESLTQVVAGIRGQVADPQHILVLIHGFDTARAASTQQYTTIANLAIPEYKALGKNVAVVGLQWHSDLGPPKFWLVKVITATLGLDSDNPYLAKVALGQNVGRTAARQLVDTLNKQFPNAQVDVFAHSLGGDVTRNMIGPNIPNALKRNQFMPPLSPAYSPDDALRFGLVGVCGADVDYDFLYKNKDLVRNRGALKLLWLTVGGIKNPDRRDLILSLRALARGDRAMGNTIPKMSRAQIDMFCANRLLVLDGNNIPMDHVMLKYFDHDRVKKLVGAAVGVSDASHPDALLTRLDEIIKAPADPKVLEKFFVDNHELSVTYYTLWRLENLVCGQPRHLSDGYLEWLSVLVRDFPHAVKEQRWKGPCKVVRDGYWPTDAMIYKAITELPGLEGRPQPPDVPFMFP